MPLMKATCRHPIIIPQQIYKFSTRKPQGLGEIVKCAATCHGNEAHVGRLNLAEQSSFMFIFGIVSHDQFKLVWVEGCRIKDSSDSRVRSSIGREDKRYFHDWSRQTGVSLPF